MEHDDYVEIEIAHPALVSLPQEQAEALDSFFYTHDGWEMHDRAYTGGKVIRFYSHETFREFLALFGPATEEAISSHKILMLSR